MMRFNEAIDQALAESMSPSRRLTMPANVDGSSPRPAWALSRSRWSASY